MKQEISLLPLKHSGNGNPQGMQIGGTIDHILHEHILFRSVRICFVDDMSASFT